MNIGTYLKNLKMNIQLKFIAIHKSPECTVSINDQVKYQGPVQDIIDVAHTDTGPAQLSIAFTNKKPEDTVVDDTGKIIEDKSFELDSITVDQYDLEELKWQSKYHCTDGQTFDQCLFFGPPGKFVIDLENPILPWILGTKHKLNNNDPDWQEDYNYYVQACQLLQQI